jgi:hypothetical protein
MASNKEISISSDDLSKEGYSALAVKTPDNKLDASRLDTEAAREEVTKLAKALTDKSSTIQNVTAADLSALLEEAQNTAQQAAATTAASTIPEKQKSEIPADIKTAADTARLQVKKTFWEIGSKDYRTSMSTFREYILQYIPWLDVSGADDIADAMYQPRARIEQIIDALEQAWMESSDRISLPNKYLDNKLLNEAFSAMGFSAISDKDLNDPEKKKKAILWILTQLTQKMEWREAGSWMPTTLIGDAWWAGIIVGWSYLGLWKIPSMVTHAILSKIPFVGKHLAGVTEIKRWSWITYKAAKWTYELWKKVLPTISTVGSINTLHTLWTITTASQKITEIQSKLPTSVAKQKLDWLKTLATEIDAMPKWVSTIFSSAAKSNEINTRIVWVLKNIPDDFLKLMQQHSDAWVKQFAEQLTRAVTFAKNESTAITWAKLLIEILKKVK